MWCLHSSSVHRAVTVSVLTCKNTDRICLCKWSRGRPKVAKEEEEKNESWCCFHCSGHLQCFHHVLLFNLVHVRRECVLFFSRKIHWNPITLPFTAILISSFHISFPCHITTPVTSFQSSPISTQALSYCTLTVGVHSRAARKSFSYPRARRLWLVTLSSMAS